jgi:hypothetical protein
MLTGSFAGAYHGTPRATQDIDLVIAATPAQIRALVRALSANGYYVDEAAALEALQLESQFNAIDPATGWKIDFIIRKSRPFSETEFGRRREAQVEGLTLSITTVEDLILAKLEWARLGESDRQIEDVAALIRVRRGEVDLSYVGHWVESLGIGVQWERAVRLAGTGSDGEGQQSR